MSIKQNMYGYGAALTQSSAYVLGDYKRANENNYWTLLHNLFDREISNENSAGMEVLRLPITGSDFSVKNYFTYDDVNNDFSLKSESLSNDPYTIPILQDILKINPDLKIVACPWTAPVSHWRLI